MKTIRKPKNCHKHKLHLISKIFYLVTSPNSTHGRSSFLRDYSIVSSSANPSITFQRTGLYLFNHRRGPPMPHQPPLPHDTGAASCRNHRPPMAEGIYGHTQLLPTAHSIVQPILIIIPTDNAGRAGGMDMQGDQQHHQQRG